MTSIDKITQLKNTPVKERKEFIIKNMGLENLGNLEDFTDIKPNVLISDKLILITAAKYDLIELFDVFYYEKIKRRLICKLLCISLRWTSLRVFDKLYKKYQNTTLVVCLDHVKCVADVCAFKKYLKANEGSDLFYYLGYKLYNYIDYTPPGIQYFVVYPRDVKHWVKYLKRFDIDDLYNHFETYETTELFALFEYYPELINRYSQKFILECMYDSSDIDHRIFRHVNPYQFILFVWAKNKTILDEMICYLSVNIANHAFIADDIDLLKQLISHKIYPDVISYTSKKAIKYCSMFDWFDKTPYI